MHQCSSIFPKQISTNASTNREERCFSVRGGSSKLVWKTWIITLFLYKVVFMMPICDICEHTLVMNMWAWRQRNLQPGGCEAAAWSRADEASFLTERSWRRRPVLMSKLLSILTHPPWTSDRQHESAQKCASCLKGTLWWEGNTPLSSVPLRLNKALHFFGLQWDLWWLLPLLLPWLLPNHSAFVKCVWAEQKGQTADTAQVCWDPHSSFRFAIMMMNSSSYMMLLVSLLQTIWIQ